MATRIPLKRALFGKSWLDVDGHRVELVAGLYLKERWRLDASRLAVVDGAPRTTSDVVYETPPRIPYFQTGSSFSRPTTTVLFDAPQLVPPTRWGQAKQLGVGKGSDGRVDGFALTVDDPAAAVEVLRAAGATVVPDQDAWLAERRRVVRGARAKEVAGRRRRSRLALIAIAVAFLIVMAGFVLLGPASGSTFWPWVIGVGVLTVGLQIAVRILGRRMRT